MTGLILKGIGMIKTIIIILSIIFSPHPAPALENHSVVADYEIHAKIEPYLNKSSNLCYMTTIKIKDVSSKDYVKAWDKDTNLLDFSLSGNKSSNYYKYISANCGLPCYGTCLANDIEAQNFADAYVIFSADIFKVAKIIQNSGYITSIVFDGYNLIKINKYWLKTSIQPTGEWQ
jgi:hypothetical protein